MLVYLFRHGIAVDRDDPACPPDPERPLTDAGVKKTRAAARGLKVLGVRPALILTSPYLRAVQTAEIAREVLGGGDCELKETDALEPGADPAEALAEISEARVESILCAGHAPDLDELCAAALGRPGKPFTHLKKAGCLCLDLSGDSRGAEILTWLLPARVLRKLGGES